MCIWCGRFEAATIAETMELPRATAGGWIQFLQCSTTNSIGPPVISHNEQGHSSEISSQDLSHEQHSFPTKSSLNPELNLSPVA